MKKPTIKDVAAKACVSTALVSRVMNAKLRPDGTPDCVVHPETAKRIFDAVSQLGYHPNKAAVSLRKVLKRRIGVIIPDIANPFFADIARRIESLARKNGYIVLFGSTDENASQLGTLAEAFMEDGVDGIILTPGAGCKEHVEKVVSQGIPVVLTVRDIPDLEGVSRILTDDSAATELVIDHFFSQGFKRVDMISPSARISNAQQRENLFEAAMKKSACRHKIHHESAIPSPEETKLILEDAIRRDVDALYCSSASIPVRVLHAAREMKIRIPEDIALLGYDGGDIYEILSPSISEIEFKKEDIALEAYSALMERISHPDTPPVTKFLTPVLHQRESTKRIAPHRSNIEKEKTEELLSALSKASLSIRNVLRELNG